MNKLQILRKFRKSIKSYRFQFKNNKFPIYFRFRKWCHVEVIFNEPELYKNGGMIIFAKFVKLR